MTFWRKSVFDTLYYNLKKLRSLLWIGKKHTPDPAGPCSTFGLESKAGAMLPAPVHNAPPCTLTSFHYCYMKGKISSCPVPKMEDVCLEERVSKRWVSQSFLVLQRLGQLLTLICTLAYRTLPAFFLPQVEDFTFPSGVNSKYHSFLTSPRNYIQEWEIQPCLQQS